MLLEYQEVTACEKRNGGTNSIFLSQNVMSVHPRPEVEIAKGNIYKSNSKLGRDTS